MWVYISPQKDNDSYRIFSDQELSRIIENPLLLLHLARLDADKDDEDEDGEDGNKDEDQDHDQEYEDKNNENAKTGQISFPISSLRPGSNYFCKVGQSGLTKPFIQP